MARKKKPDKLSQEVAQALACGLSYGKWKALQPIVEVQQKKEGKIACAYCGNTFVPIYNKGRKFCNFQCATAAHQQREKERKKRKDAEKDVTT